MSISQNIGVSPAVISASRALLAKSQLRSKDYGDGIWRTTEDGSKIFISSGGEVRAGGPGGKVLTPARSESKKQPEAQKPAKDDNKPSKGSGDSDQTRQWANQIAFSSVKPVEAPEDAEETIFGKNGYAEKTLGPEWNKKIPQILGAPDGASVEINDQIAGHTLEVSFYTGRDSGRVAATRHINLRDKTIRNVAIQIQDTGKSYGTQIFDQQVREAAKAGFVSITTEAARSSGENGYYTWARLGYDAPIHPGSFRTPDRDRVVAQIKKTFPEAKNISDLMKTPKGREWWKKSGVTFLGEFDLAENSQSRRVLDAYVAAKKPSKPKQATKSLAKSCGANTTGGGGFQPGNTCGSKQGSDSTSGPNQKQSDSFGKSPFLSKVTHAGFEVDEAGKFDFASKQVVSVTPKQAKSIEAYQAEGTYEELNGMLRMEAIDPSLATFDKAQKQIISDLDEAFKKNKLASNTVLFRGVNDDEGWFSALQPGDEFMDHAYQSTTLNPFVAFGFAEGYGGQNEKPIVLRMQATKGQPAIAADVIAAKQGKDMKPDKEQAEMQGFSLLNEVILPRGTAYRVTGRAIEEGVEYVDVEIQR